MVCTMPIPLQRDRGGEVLQLLRQLLTAEPHLHVQCRVIQHCVRNCILRRREMRITIMISIEADIVSDLAGMNQVLLLTWKGDGTKSFAIDARSSSSKITRV